jgi:hypothetical protein
MSNGGMAANEELKRRWREVGVAYDLDTILALA